MEDKKIYAKNIVRFKMWMTSSTTYSTYGGGVHDVRVMKIQLTTIVSMMNMLNSVRYG
jgi:hypothetical protein